MIRFLKQFLRRFIGSDLEPKLPVVVQPQELIARFIFSREHFAETLGLVKAKAFLPNKNGEVFETSVFRITTLSNDAIWEIGNKIRTEKVKARGEVIHSAIQRIGLRVESAPEDHPRHAVIVGWSGTKHEMLMLATLLSKEASLHVAHATT